MIKFFNDVWLAVNPASPDPIVDTLLNPESADDFWMLLVLKNERVVINCTDEKFYNIVQLFLYNVLKDNSSENVQHLTDLVRLNMHLGGRSSNAQSFDVFEVPSLALLSLENFRFEFQLPNFLLTGNGKEQLIGYVRWCCWSLLSQEITMFATDMKRDIFNAHHVVGKDIHLSSLAPTSIVDTIKSDSSWSFILDTLDCDDPFIESKVRELFPTYQELIDMFNNHAIAHRDEQGVNSYLEPVRLIYGEQYEELLYRDMGNDCRITYLSDSLGENSICTFVSKVYWAFKNSPDPKSVYKMFELKCNKL